MGIEPTGRALVDAVGENNHLLVDSLLAAGVMTEQKDEQGRTPLRIAIDSKDLATTSALIEDKADVNAVKPDGSSILGAAVELGNLSLVQKLVTAGSHVDGALTGGELVLPWAIRLGKSDLIQVLMAANPDPHMKDRDGNPLLHLAMNAHRRDLVDLLLKQGADPGQANASGETTLHVAIRNGWFDVIPALITAGADPNLPGPSGASPLSQAVIDADKTLINVLLKSGADPNYRHPSEALPESVLAKTPLELAFVHPDRRVFQAFLDRKIRLEPARMNAWLWQAFEQRDLPLAQILLSHGADLGIRNPQGWLPIEMAVLREDGNFVKLFSDYGSPAGRTLHLAAAQGDVRMASLLLALGADPDVIHPPYADRPLAIAIRARHDGFAVALIQGGAGLDFRLPEGQFPLYLAVATGCAETVKCLIAAGADPNTPFQLPVKPEFIRQVRPGVMRWCLKNDSRVTLLMVAIDSGVTSTARYLLDGGAKTEVWTRVSDMWPINFASRRGDVKMMRLILGRDPQREERHIVIHISEQRARLFDSSGTEIFNTKVSTGRKGFDTPTGEYVITNKYRDWTSTLYHASMPYFQRLSCSDFGLHAGVVPGYPASHGCIRVPAENAAKLFSMTQAGDRVRIVP